LAQPPQREVFEAVNLGAGREVVVVEEEEAKRGDFHALLSFPSFRQPLPASQVVSEETREDELGAGNHASV
jgi:hypothetical protein